MNPQDVCTQQDWIILLILAIFFALHIVIDIVETTDDAALSKVQEKEEAA